jgi:hypothetical protein
MRKSHVIRCIPQKETPQIEYLLMFTRTEHVVQNVIYVRVPETREREILLAALSYSSTKGTDRQISNFPRPTSSSTLEEAPRRDLMADTKTFVSDTIFRTFIVVLHMLPVDTLTILAC